MKIFILLILILIGCQHIPETYASGTYARIIDNDTFLFKTASNEENTKNIICIMENTYYVEIVLIYDEDFYKVNYNGVSGYVLRNKVKKVSEIPQNPYPSNIEILTINNNIYLRSSPEKANNNISIISANNSRLRFVGKTYGEQLDDFRENVWYFVEYDGIYGYVYGEYIKSISPIHPNIEQISYLNENDFDDIINPLSDSECAIIIVLLLLPILLFIFLIYKKPPNKKSYKEKVITIKEYDEKL